MGKKNNSEVSFGEKLKRLLGIPPTKGELIRTRNMHFAATGFSAISILVLLDIGLLSMPLKVSLFCFSAFIPLCLFQAFSYDIYLRVGKQFYPKISHLENKAIFYIPGRATDLLFVGGFTSIIWHLSITAALIFISSIVVAYSLSILLFSKIEFREKDQKEERKQQ